MLGWFKKKFGKKPEEPVPPGPGEVADGVLPKVPGRQVEVGHGRFNSPFWMASP